jgi:phage shock protein PspC (stress-responsive transcriptional regulator)
MTNRLHKSRSSRVLAGVCGGLAEYFAIDPTIVRLLFVLLGVFQGMGFLAYIVLWIVMPEESASDLPPRDSMRENINKMRSDVQQFGSHLRGGAERPPAESAGQTEPLGAEGSPETTFQATQTGETLGSTEIDRPVETYRSRSPVPPVDRSTASSRQMLAGAALLIIGALMLLDNLNVFWWFSWGRMWPLILVAIGAWLLYDRSKARTQQ